MSDYKPQAFEHPVTKATRTVTSVAQEVAAKFDGFRPVETKKSAKSDSTTPTPTSTSGNKSGSTSSETAK
jgi:hypothetical protein